MGSDDREIDSICLHMVARNLADVAIVDVDIEEGLRRRRQSGRTQESIQFHRDIRLLSRGGPLATAQRLEPNMLGMYECDRRRREKVDRGCPRGSRAFRKIRGRHELLIFLFPAALDDSRSEERRGGKELFST